ncbi:hypothetical protein CAPTEDRAFT_188987, partial [Capitella teleta]
MDNNAVQETEKLRCACCYDFKEIYCVNIAVYARMAPCTIFQTTPLPPLHRKLATGLESAQTVMPRNKKRKTLSHGQTEPTAMKAAVAMVLEGADSIRNVAKDTGIAKSTLQRYVNKAKHAQSTDIRLKPAYDNKL